jgi:hypothetical protein
MLDITAQFVQVLNAKFGDTYLFTVEYGKKYDRIVQEYSKHFDSRHRSVHAFVERSNGKLIKAAGWAAPQRDKSGLAYRYDLSTAEGFKKAADSATSTGGYLYL